MKLKLCVIFLIQLVDFGASFSDLSELKFQEKAFESVDDVLCDRQLIFFSDSLAKRELWALESGEIIH
jgi:hypothetical protein